MIKIKNVSPNKKDGESSPETLKNEKVDKVIIPLKKQDGAEPSIPEALPKEKFAPKNGEDPSS